jgi:hypothetical protein
MCIGGASENGARHMANRTEPEGNEHGRRVTVSIDAFRSSPADVAQQALTKEVEIIVDDQTRIYVARKLAPLDSE